MELPQIQFGSYLGPHTYFYNHFSNIFSQAEIVLQMTCPNPDNVDECGWVEEHI